MAPPPKHPTPSLRDSCLVFLTDRLARRLSRRLERALRPVELRPNQLLVLATLRLAEPLTLTGLARLAEVDATTMTRVLQGLRARRLVQVRHGADRRTVDIRLSAFGNRRLDVATRICGAVQSEMMRQLPVRSHEVLRALDRAFVALAEPAAEGRRQGGATSASTTRSE